MYRQIKASILNGSRAPGYRLTESETADQMGVSRGPVREAFRRLEADGLIERRARYGAYVRGLTEREVSEIYSARALIEGHVATLAAQRASSEEVADLKAAMAKAQRKAQSDDYRATVIADFRLHRRIWEIADHGTFCRILEGLVEQLHVFMVAHAPLFSHLYESVKDHSEIVAAIENHDEEAARLSMARHVRQAEILAYEKLAGKRRVPVGQDTKRSADADWTSPSLLAESTLS